MQVSSETISDFERDGFAVFKAAVSSRQIEQLTECVEAIRSEKATAGLRNLLIRCPSINSFANSSITSTIAEKILGAQPRPVRAILFDKTPATNWYVTWHQDLSIPVQTRVDTDGYGPWSTKDGVLHVQPPASILEQMVSLRIHLDACDESNGVIKFIPGSHRSGILEADDVVQIRSTQSAVACPVASGDIIAMRPLILHSSSVAESPAHRRVLHLEYAGASLPAGMEWAQA